MTNRLLVVFPLLLALSDTAGAQNFRAEGTTGKLLASAEASRSQQSALRERSVLLAAEALRRVPNIEAARSLRESLTSLPHSGAVMKIADGEDLEVFFSASGRYAATLRPREGAQVWDLLSGKEVLQVRGAELLAFSLDSRFVATLGPEGRLAVQAIEGDRSPAHSLQLEGGFTALAVSPDIRYVAASTDSATYIYDLLSGDQTAKIDTMTPVEGLLFSPSSRHLAMIGEHIVLWDLLTRKEVIDVDPKREKAPFAFSPDGRYLAVLTEPNKAEVFETATGHSAVECNHEDAITSIAFNHAGTLLATAGDDSKVRLWAWPGGRPLKSLDHDGAVKSLGFSAKDKYLATTTEQNEVIVWNLATGRPLQRIGGVKNGDEEAQPDQEEMGTPVFSADGRYLVMANAKSLNALLWKPEDLIADACSSLTRNLTPREWKSYLKYERYSKTCPELP